MTKRFTVTFSDAQWAIIEQHAPTKGKPALMVRALLAKLLAEQGVEFPDDVAPLGGYRGGGRPKKRKDE